MITSLTRSAQGAFPSRISRTGAAFLALASISTLAACADKEEPGAEATAMTVTATDSTCDVSGTEATTGTASFDVSNNGEKTTEFYVYTSGGRVIGEVENIGPGATRKLIAHFAEPGDYTLTCKPGMVGDGFSAPLTVTGEAQDATEGDDALAEATEGYITYVRTQTRSLDSMTSDWVDAIEAGDVDEAKRLYPLVRTPYERIEPVAESFPDDLDPRIDLREADIQEGDTWTGFHKIEKQLWVDGKITDQTKADAQQLRADITELVDQVALDSYEISPVQIASGAQGLLDEIATSKITGEEDIFSHTDLYDFQANLDGSRAAIAALEVPLNEREPELLGDINSRFDDVQKLLDGYREGDAFIPYEEVNQDQRRELSDTLDMLTAKVATVQEVVA